MTPVVIVSNEAHFAGLYQYFSRLFYHCILHRRQFSSGYYFCSFLTLFVPEVLHSMPFDCKVLTDWLLCTSWHFTSTSCGQSSATVILPDRTLILCECVQINYENVKKLCSARIKADTALFNAIHSSDLWFCPVYNNRKVYIWKLIFHKSLHNM